MKKIIEILLQEQGRLRRILKDKEGKPHTEGVILQLEKEIEGLDYGADVLIEHWNNSNEKERKSYIFDVGKSICPYCKKEISRDKKDGLCYCYDCDISID